MDQSGWQEKVVRFGDMEVDLRTGWLSRPGGRVRLRRQLLTALAMLLERAGEVVSREELQRRLWPGDTVVDFEIDLNTIMARLREALEDSAEHPRYIETVPKRGYLFAAAVSACPVAAPFPRRRLRLAVLPFLNAGGDPAEEYFSDAMTDELITVLCRVAPRELAVIARTTAMHYKNREKDVAQIGRELGVDYILEGGARRGEAQAVLNVQLIQTSDQAHIFAERYVRPSHGVLAALDDIAADVARNLGVPQAPEGAPPARPAETSALRRPAADAAAYDEYIRARYDMSKGSAEGFASARQHLQRAIARDAEFAPAYDTLAEIDWYLGYFGYVPPQKAFSDGIVNALRAVEIDNSRAETHALLGEFHKTLDYNWPEVHREMTLALKLDPASPTVRLRYAVSGLMPHGRLEEAIAELEAALDSDPLSMLAQAWLGIMLVLAHEWDRAIEQGLLLLKIFPAHFWGHFVLGVAYREKGQLEKAIASLRQALGLSGMPGLMGWLGMTLAKSGNGSEARSLLAALQAKASKGYVPPTSFAWIHLGLEELDTAFEWLDRAVEERDQFMMPIKSYRFFDPIRSDPRFPPLVRKMNLEP